jgi:hypothetical protein
MSLQEDTSMERLKARQASLFENRPVIELPEAQRQKALVLVGSLLTEALAIGSKCGELETLREGGHDEDHC